MEPSPLVRRHLNGAPPPITIEEFLSKLWKLNQVGDQEETYITVCLAILKKKCFDGSPVTFKLIVEKYTAYMKFCAAQQTPAKFTKRINGFVKDGGYNTDFKVSNASLKERFNL